MKPFYSPFGWIFGWKDLAFLAAIVAVFALFFFILVHAIFTKQYCIVSSEIFAVGGCDRSGYCGVRLENGISSRERYPVVGDAVCLRRETRWEF